ncbi:TPA: hypothetical protein ACSTL5_000190 [Serratia fonticola]
MPIVLTLRNSGNNKAKLVSSIRNCVNLSMSEVLNKVGSDEPVFSRDLFDDIHDPDFPKRLSILMKELNDLNVDYSICELPRGISFDKNSVYYELNIDRLKNMVDARKKSMKRQWS